MFAGSAGSTGTITRCTATGRLFIAVKNACMGVRAMPTGEELDQMITEQIDRERVMQDENVSGLSKGESGRRND